MPDLTPADELRAAAATARDWAAADSSDLWLPSALAAFGPGLARWLDATAIRLEGTTHAAWQDAIEPQALATARAINATAGGQP